ncbi:hypothetical protein FRC02_000181 [Tulasnella sp. 418]|nr:hypothetical protein FRC02_000181 [Tulasnella sp. 418]
MTSPKKTGAPHINIKETTHTPGGNSKAKGRNKARASGSGDSPRPKQRDSSNSPVKVRAITPWTSKLNGKVYLSGDAMLLDEVLSFIDWITPTAVEHQTRLLVIEQIRQQVAIAYPGATTEAFGSLVTGLYLPEGDIDIVVRISLSKNEEVVPTLKVIAEKLRVRNVARNITVIDGARVPIIKLISNYGNFPIDISINQEGGIRTAELVNQWLHELPALRVLVMIVKVILSQQSLNEVYKGGIGSYTVILMVKSFLQMHKGVQSGAVDPMKNIGTLLHSFLYLYGFLFNYEKFGISVLGKGTYFLKRDRGWLKSKQPHFLSIEDPTNPSNDVAKGSYNISQVKGALRNAYGALNEKRSELNSLLARQPQEHKGLETTLPQTHSILGSILHIPEHILNERHSTVKLYKSKQLHRVLGVEYLPDPAPPTCLESLAQVLMDSSASLHEQNQAGSSSGPTHQSPRVKLPTSSTGLLVSNATPAKDSRLAGSGPGLSSIAATPQSIKRRRSESSTVQKRSCSPVLEVHGSEHPTKRQRQSAQINKGSEIGSDKVEEVTSSMQGEGLKAMDGLGEVAAVADGREEDEAAIANRREEDEVELILAQDSNWEESTSPTEASPQVEHIHGAQGTEEGNEVNGALPDNKKTL